VLARVNDAGLNPAALALSRALLEAQPEHPAVLTYSARALENAGRKEDALSLLRRLADSGFEDDELTLDACLRVGDHLAPTDQGRARDYYWRVVKLGCAWPGRPMARIDRAIASLKALDGDAR
jgi:hypothetical protein